MAWPAILGRGVKTRLWYFSEEPALPGRRSSRRWPDPWPAGRGNSSGGTARATRTCKQNNYVKVKRLQVLNAVKRMTHYTWSRFLRVSLSVVPDHRLRYTNSCPKYHASLCSWLTWNNVKEIGYCELPSIFPRTTVWGDNLLRSRVHKASASALQWRLWHSSHWKEWSHSRMGCNLFWSGYVTSAIAALTLTFGVNVP